MENFRKEIVVDNQKRMFEFTRMRNMSGVKFFITSMDASKKPIACSLKQTDEGNWKLVPGSIRWLYAIETELSDAIIDTTVES